MNPGPYNETGVEWGYASSPVIFNNRIIIQCDKTVGSYLASYDIESGEQLWRTEREEVSTWGTPALYTGQGKTQVIVNGFKHMGGYELETGKEIWKMSGGGDAPSTTPVIANDLIYINNAHRKIFSHLCCKANCHRRYHPGRRQYQKQLHRLECQKGRGLHANTLLSVRDYYIICR